MLLKLLTKFDIVQTGARGPESFPCKNKYPFFIILTYGSAWAF